MTQFADRTFTDLLEAAPDAMVCVDGKGQIALVNAQAERLFGYSREELTGRPVEALVPDPVRGRHPGHREAYMADPSPRPMGAGTDLAARRRDGTTFPAEISLSAIRADDGILITAAVRDITERREIQAERERLIAQAERARLERRLEQSRRLESLGQLAGGVAHDFNNLLAVITGWTAIIGEDLASPTPDLLDSVRAQVGEIDQAARRAADLTRQLLAFARKEVVQPRVLSLNVAVSAVQQLLVRTLGEHIEYRTDLAGDLRPVLADPGQIEQVLVNLAVNARDAMPAGGQLAVTTANLRVDAAARAAWGDPAPGEYVTLKVADTGSGIPEEIADRVCEPFFTTKPDGAGTGLGLATVYGIVSQAGGFLRIDSEPGLGTSVTALLPATRQAPEAPASSSARPRRGAGESVLVVEDEGAVREVTKHILTRNGYQVATAADGAEALTILQTHPAPIDVLITDVVMPQLPGKELADRARRIQPDVRVLFMSGYTQGLLNSQGILEPGLSLIEKPFDQTTLLRAVSDILSSPA
jgi:PAS domain S-box-containing protein